MTEHSFCSSFLVVLNCDSVSPCGLRTTDSIAMIMARDLDCDLIRPAAMEPQLPAGFQDRFGVQQEVLKLRFNRAAGQGEGA
jgi:hypothetical protein